MVDFEALKQDYCTVTPEDDDEMLAYKTAMLKLPDVKLKIWLLYVDLGTYTGLARFLKNSPPTAKKVVSEIRNMILEQC
jgi:hypothetical protein